MSRRRNKLHPHSKISTDFCPPLLGRTFDSSSQSRDPGRSSRSRDTTSWTEVGSRRLYMNGNWIRLHTWQSRRASDISTPRRAGELEPFDLDCGAGVVRACASAALHLSECQRN